MCPKCGCDDPSMLEQVTSGRWFCNNCSHDWVSASDRSASLSGERPPSVSGERPPRFSSLDDLVARSGLRRDELVTLADLGALNAFGYDRRSALWQAERAVRPSGELFDNAENAETAEAAERADAAEIFFGSDFSFADVTASPDPPVPTSAMSSLPRPWPSARVGCGYRAGGR